MDASKDTPPAQAAGEETAHGADLVGAAIGLGALVLLALSPRLVDADGPDPFYKGPLIFPMIALAMTAAAALPSGWRLLRGLRGRGAGALMRLDGNGFPRAGAVLFALMCLYPPAIGAVGLDAATALALLAGLVVTGRPPLQALAVALVLTAAVHLAFVTVLDTWFPQPWLPETILGG